MSRSYRRIPRTFDHAYGFASALMEGPLFLDDGVADFIIAADLRPGDGICGRTVWNVEPLPGDVMAITFTDGSVTTYRDRDCVPVEW